MKEFFENCKKNALLISIYICIAVAMWLYGWLAFQIPLTLKMQFFGFGILISAILGSLLYFWETNLRKYKQIEKIKEDNDLIMKRMNLALDSTQVAIWHWDLIKNEIASDYRFSALYGRKDSVGNKLTDYIKPIHADDKEAVQLAVQRSLDFATPYDMQYRIIWDDGSLHYVQAKGEVYCNQNTPVEFTGICWDITKQQQHNQLIKAQKKIADILLESGVTASISNDLLHTICEILQWDVAVLWRTDNIDNHLYCLGSWYDSKLDISNLKELTSKIIPKKEFLNETFWNNPQYRRIENIEGEFLSRYRQISKDGLKGSLVIPFICENVVLGVLELFQKDIYKQKQGIDEVCLLDMICREVVQSLVRCEFAETRLLLKTIMQSTIDAIIITTVNGTITVWNKGAEEMFGYTEQEIVGKSLKMLFPPEKIDEYMMIFNKVKEGKTIQDIETTRLRKDGEFVWLLDNVFPAYDTQGHINRVCMIKQNITKRKNIEKNLVQSEENLRIFAETTDNWIWTIDQHRKLTFSNVAIFSILGFTIKEALGSDILLFIPEEDRDAFNNDFQNYLQKRKGWSGKVARWRHKNGSIKWLESSAEPIFKDGNEEVIGFRGADRDVSARKNLDMIKSEFISTISHELRTPLTSIRGALGLLFEQNKNNTNSKEYKLLDISLNNCSRLIHIINDILDLEKMTSGKMNYKFENIQINELVNSAVKTSLPLAEKAGIIIEIENTVDDDVAVYIDSSRFTQVLNNLISNAIKVSSAGDKVTIKVTRNSATVRISVIDHGPGIPDSFRTKIFEKFAQADSSSSRSLEGTGLGLNICKNFLEQMGSSINYTSEKNKGTTFYFDLPIIENKIHKNEEKGRLILVCEKDQSLASELTSHLKNEGFNVVVASSLEMIRNLLKEHNFEAALMDIDLVRNGDSDSFYKILNEEKNVNMPVIFIGFEETAEGLKLNTNVPIPIIDFLPKPFSKERLGDIIKNLKKSLTPSLPRILHIEDDKDLIYMVKMLFINDAIIEPAYSLKEGKDKLNNHSYDLVLLDMLLPDGSGSEILPCIDSETKKSIPVVIFTIKEDVKQCNLDVDHVLIKTLTPEQDLLGAIKSIINKKKNAQFSQQKEELIGPITK